MTCSDSLNRELIETTHTCDCKKKYYDDGNSECAACYYTCYTCDGSLFNNCLTCNSDEDRIKIGNECPCHSSFFENSSKLCEACSVKCLTCDGNTESNCLTCNSDTLFRVIETPNSSSKCICQDGWVEVNDVCEACNYTCKTCDQLTTTDCLTCDKPTLHRELKTSTSECICENGYVQVTVECEKCEATCLTCSGLSKNDCLTCDSNLFRETEGISTPTKCICQDGWVELNDVCEACNYTCKTCDQLTTTDCLTCDSPTKHRTLNVGTSACICEDGYV